MHFPGRGICIVFLLQIVINLSECAPSSEKWKYVDVRKDAHMFWWLYPSTQTKYDPPLIVWLQGGPGSSSTGFGNFEELGPLDVQLRPRNTTWVSVAHVLFVDNPVGTGYSYVSNDTAYTHNVEEITADLLTLFSSFLDDLPEFKTTPVYIFSESYGGKMNAAFSLALHQAIASGKISCNFKGLALGDSWISPIDSVLTWGPYLYGASLVGEEGLSAINEVANQCNAAIKSGNYTEATMLWSKAEDVIEEKTSGVNMYNILKWSGSTLQRHKNINHVQKLYNRHVKPTQNDDLAALMNGPIRRKLGVIPDKVTWGGQSAQVFSEQAGDFMKPVVSIVNELLEQTDLQVVVYSGQLDLIVDTLGTEAWVNRLQSRRLNTPEPRKPFYIASSPYPVGYNQKNGKFSFYWILNSGHMVPADAGQTALAMVKAIIGAQ